MIAVVAIAASYLLGSIPFALLAARRWSAIDLRAAGSGNLGAANVMRTSGIAAGMIVAALDILKGAAGVALAERLAADASVSAAAGVAAVVGHVYPMWLRFRGGKGVATACGVFSMLTPLAVPPALSVFLATVWVTKYVSFGSIVASLALPPIVYASGGEAPAVYAALAIASLVVFRHRTNVARLRAGTERRIGARA